MLKKFHSRLESFWRRRINPKLMWLAAKSFLGSGIYYGVLNRSLRRESRAVLSGRLLFQGTSQDELGLPSELRRATHRIEKGLTMLPLRVPFALGYIARTVLLYETALKAQFDERGSLTDELRWVHDVLKEYFCVCGGSSEVEGPMASFEATWQLYRPLDSNRKPFLKPDDVGRREYESLKRIARQRRSTRWFTDKKVDRKLILDVIEIARQAPSACNRQPFYIRIFDDPGLVRKVSRLPPGTRGLDHQFPVIGVIIGRLRCFAEERDRHLIYVDGAMFAMSFITAAETLGLGTCCINWPDIESEEALAAEVLNLEVDERPIMFVAIGHPNRRARVPYSEKRGINGLCRFNFDDS